jgi:hypothetical protein
MIEKESEETHCLFTKINLIKDLLKRELAKLDRRQDEDDELFDSEYTSLKGNGINCSEANSAIRPLAEAILNILNGKKVKLSDYE